MDLKILQATRHTYFPSEHDTLEATRTSQAELGAVLRIIGNLWQSLRSGSIELSTARTHRTSMWPNHLRILKTFIRTWENFLRRPIDVVGSIILSTLFVGIFVAESTVNVLSGNVVGDTTALVSSPEGSIDQQSDISRFQPDAFDYSQPGYRTRHGTRDCNFFYNQSIVYTEAIIKSPFTKEIHREAGDSALTFDTGFVDAQVIGLNSANIYQFRRTASCTPLKAKNQNQELKLEDDGGWPFSCGLPAANTF